MIRQYELIDKILKYNEKADIALINRAYVFSMKAHGNQKRASGEPYLTHPLAVAEILADLKLDEASIAVGLLHDTLEDTLTTYDELKKLFGADVADLTEGVTKLSRVKFDDKKVEQAENFRKLLLAMSEDIRVLLVKLADRLHNMRTLEFFKGRPDKQKRIAMETMELFVPLADRIGLYSVKIELEDLSFRYIEPEEYVRIQTQLKELVAQDDLIPRVLGALKEDLAQSNIKADVAGREKTVMSIYRKMEKKNLTFDQLTDIVAYRIIVDSTAACYEVLGHIHNVYKAIPGKFKDYISSPKPNGYQSLHTSVIGPFGNRMEIQIRTREMHEISENGVAAHWMYKEGKKNNHQAQKEGEYYSWLKALVDDLQDMEDPDEFFEHAKMDLFNDNVFVFTPRGDLISLPRGSTPLDFAYSVHSDIGNHCQTAKINGNVVQLRTPLENGDQIEIVTNKSQTPSPAWRDFVVTSRARSAINRYLSNQERDEQIRLGREILDKASKRDGYKVADKDLNKISKQVKADSLDDVFVGMAQGRIFPKQVFDILFPRDEREEKAEETLEPQEIPVSRAAPVSGVEIKGLIPGMAIHVAKCCSPLPGESIVGIVTTGRGVTIHAKNCKNLEALSDQPDRWLSVSWGGDEVDQAEGQGFTTRLRVTVNHEPGALSSFSTAVFNAEGNIVDLHIHDRNTDSYAMICDVEVQNLEHFNKMVSIIKNLKCVIDVERMRG